ncbi:1-deoxy-D-xylulose-5-phosphate reductoisomerase [Nesterenkonia xinjiangensis]|uniref:1-deoxy-D-xylulose 5-phosphate reductoisomerase n=1 Tax=Nesterenkonia xinjiangensis TaxID=225327 RepID=A0A7Z0GNB8_9MICC|nr:1-deoxy-D-xylulose-5-phosphate reductoisomerase [Nesterenkonia xinjiangensis]NYJ79060.1 1-deoxy-D-xylulose-5-phosphate reductoisomerase [Nesterenkonia xinjiangensis]
MSSHPSAAPSSPESSAAVPDAVRRSDDGDFAASPETVRRVVLLGSTGSIGTQALEVIAANPGRFEVVGLAAGANTRLLAEQVRATGARAVGIAVDGGTAANPDHPPLAEALRAAGVSHPVEVLSGAEAAVTCAGQLGADVVLNGMTGSIGLRPTLAALASGATLALANKESLVVGGALVAAALRRPGQVVPVDSEHSALAQALGSGRHERGLSAASVTGRSEVRRLIVTASGGPFRGWGAEQLQEVTPAQALRHPNFAMGRVVTTNSATMVNKALEVIEAHLLFDVPLADITAVVHPQQIIHSLVEFQDGSTIAQAGPPRMYVPIALGLSWPERLPQVDAPVDWTQAMSWDFEPLDDDAFPAVRLAKQACAASATHMAVYNAANEQAVDAFHEGALRFTDILPTVERVLAHHDGGVGPPSLEEVLGAEQEARSRADELIAAASVSSPGAGAGASKTIQDDVMEGQA